MFLVHCSFLILLFGFVSSSLLELSEGDHASVERFREYLRMKTAYPHPDFEPATQWIREQAESLDLTYKMIKTTNTSSGFTILLTWPGEDPNLESIFLYSHIDVVSVDSEWTHDPFGGEIDQAGNIYGRGAQDMKSVGVQYFEAIRNMKAKGFRPNRTIYIGFFPDEETGGHEGIQLFIDTPEFKSLNKIGLLLDEGMPNETPNPNQFNIYFAQRSLVWVKFTAFGSSGHGSLLLNNTAAEKIARIITKLLAIREIEKTRFEQDGTLTLGDVTTINLNVLEGGRQPNIIPPKLSVTFDMRFTPVWNYSAIMTLLNETCVEAGQNVTFEIIHDSLNPNGSMATTALDPTSWWWINFQKAFASMNSTLVPRVFPAGTDGEVTRRLGIPTLGFSPIYDTKMLFHDRDEYLNVAVFLRGIQIYETLLETLAFVPPPPTTMPPKTKPPFVILPIDNESPSVAMPSKESKGKSAAAKTSGFIPGLCITFFIIMLQ